MINSSRPRPCNECPSVREPNYSSKIRNRGLVSLDAVEPPSNGLLLAEAQYVGASFTDYQSLLNAVDADEGKADA